MEVFSTKVDASQVDLSIVLNPDTSDTVSKPTKRAKTPTTTPGTMTVPHASNIWHTEIAVGPPIGHFQPTESLHRRGKQYVQITPNSVVRMMIPMPRTRFILCQWEPTKPQIRTNEFYWCDGDHSVSTCTHAHGWSTGRGRILRKLAPQW